jgi:hypothetical protein
MPRLSIESASLTTPLDCCCGESGHRLRRYSYCLSAPGVSRCGRATTLKNTFGYCRAGRRLRLRKICIRMIVSRSVFRKSSAGSLDRLFAILRGKNNTIEEKYGRGPSNRANLFLDRSIQRDPSDPQKPNQKMTQNDSHYRKGHKCCQGR